MVVERRKYQFSASCEALKMLTHEQNYSLGELSKAGDELAFSRQIGDEQSAVVEIVDRLVTIDSRRYMNALANVAIAKA